jgi:hypothetical protein
MYFCWVINKLQIIIPKILLFAQHRYLARGGERRWNLALGPSMEGTLQARSSASGE